MAYHVFISYRRDGGDTTAHLLYERLKRDGYTPFLDVEQMHSGLFDQQIYDRIAECDDFLLVLPPNALDRCASPDDWVRLELEEAFRLKKNVIPIMLRRFSFPETLPPSIDAIRYCQGVPYPEDGYYDAFIKRLESLLHSRRKSSLAIVLVFLLIVACVVGGWKLLSQLADRDITTGGTLYATPTAAPKSTATPTPRITPTPTPRITSTPTPRITPTPTVKSSWPKVSPSKVKVSFYPSNGKYVYAYAHPSTKSGSIVEAGGYRTSQMSSTHALFVEGDCILIELDYMTVGLRRLYFRKSAFAWKSYSIPTFNYTAHSAVTTQSVTPRWGPGTKYTSYDSAYISSGTALRVFFEESGYVFAEFSCSQGTVRAWIPASSVRAR